MNQKQFPQEWETRKQNWIYVQSDKCTNIILNEFIYITINIKSTRMCTHEISCLFVMKTSEWHLLPFCCFWWIISNHMWIEIEFERWWLLVMTKRALGVGVVSKLRHTLEVIRGIEGFTILWKFCDKRERGLKNSFFLLDVIFERAHRLLKRIRSVYPKKLNLIRI